MGDHEQAQGEPFLSSRSAASSASSSAPRACGVRCAGDAASARDRVPAARHFSALLGKNAKLKQREWSATCCPWCPLAACCELLLPLLVLLLLWWARDECAQGGQCKLPVLAGWGGKMPHGNITTECSEGLPLLDDFGQFQGYSSCKAWTDNFRRPMPFVDLLAYLHWSGKRLALAAWEPQDIPKLEGMRDWITENWFPDMYLANIPCHALEKSLLDSLVHHHSDHNGSLPGCSDEHANPGILPGFKNLTHPTIFTSSQLDAYFDSPNYGSDGQFFAAVVFHSVPGSGALGQRGQWSYSIRLNISTGTSLYTGVPSTHPLDLGLRTKEAEVYLSKGFVTLQLLVDRYIIGHRFLAGTAESLLQANGVEISKSETPATIERLSEPLRYAPEATEVAPMPVAGVVIDGFYELVSIVFPLAFIVAFLYTQKKVLNELITEKESKVRESLRMMGVSSSAIISSWYVTYATIFGILCSIFAGVASSRVFPKSAATLVFAFFWLWSMAFLSFAFFLHSFFNNSRVGGIVGMVIMFAQWIVYASQNQGEPASSGTMVALMLMPNGAFCAGLDILSKFEAAHVGATWSNLDWRVHNSNLGQVLGMMSLDIVFWTLLGWYFDRVLPKEYGVRLPPHFPCLPSYWLDRHASREQEHQGTEASSDTPAVCVGRNTSEPVPDAVRARSAASGTMVSVRNLRKEFWTPGGLKVAVQGLDLTMYEGQILALLGHNGAGKTTTVNMLTGMVAPTAGDACILGFSLHDELAQIRRLIGVCPQHDILWLELTVAEHLFIYARLRGVSSREVEHRAHDMMLRVGLSEKAATRAGSLSGGQKRKLSLALALLGRPRVCFLDEPTTGMDPLSRRGTWDVLRSAREGSINVLTTHMMDEAELLGDRIAIMAGGALQCCGSPLFLKTRFGAGYRITCLRRHTMTDPSRDRLPEVIRRHVPEVELLTNVGAELSMRLPLNATGRFAELFSELDQRLDELGVEHYGLSMVTMEEVFLRVASGEIASLDAGTFGEAQAQQLQPQLQQQQQPQQQQQQRQQQGADTSTANPARRHGLKVVAQHTMTLFMKRARYGRRDFKAIACTALLPVALLALGLALLQHASERHAPSVALDAVDQYGRSLEVPYHRVGKSWAGSALASTDVSGARLVAEDLPPGSEDGTIFGRNYSAGLPVTKMCETEVTMLSKCWREENICQKDLPKEFPLPFGNIWSIFKSLQSLGIGISCRTDQASCKQVFTDACKGGASSCTSMCVQRSGGHISRSTCRQQCEGICAHATNFTMFCSLLTPPRTIGWFCPVGCADYTNPDTCTPDTFCNLPPDLHASHPAATLDFAMLLYKQGQGTTRRNARYGALLASKNKAVDTMTLLYNTSAVHAVPVFMNLVSNALKEVASGPGSAISAFNDPMPRTRTEQFDRLVSGLVDLVTTFVVIIAFSWIPASIVAYIVREREDHHDSKHQQLISGVSLLSYWVANLMWDLCVYMVPLASSMLCMHAFDVDVFVKSGASWASFVTFLGYGLAVAPFSYVLSFFFSKHTSAQVICLVLNFVTGLLLMVTSYILSAIDNTKDVNESLMWVYRVFPGFCLGHGLFQICENNFAAMQLEDIGLEVDLLGWDVAGKDVFYLYASAVFYFVAAVAIDYLAHSPWAAWAHVFQPHVSEAASMAEEQGEDDADVAKEAARVASGAADGDVVRLAGLRKVYRNPEGTPKVAVKGLSFGLPHGECFGFLGANGAGKTSTLKMLTGAALPSGGEASVAGHDIVGEQWQVRRHLGYCPQHDALLDRLTVREHLELFGRIKFIPRSALKGYCNTMMRDLSLSEHVDKMAMTLSGGNKRKLSLAISMMGAPQLVLLDEPSSGVDPAARRLMWNVISAVSTSRGQASVILTTHNMEEAEALCSRIGIMAGGRLRCIGSNQHLKGRFGVGYQLEARVQCPSSEETLSAVEAWHLPPIIAVRDLLDVCVRLGNADRAALVQDGSEEGQAMHEAFTREGSVPSRLFAQWWLLASRAEAMGRFLAEKFPGIVPLDRQGRKMRYSLPADARLPHVFRCLDAAQEEFCLEDYSINQTTLEQIFNGLVSRHNEDHSIPGLTLVPAAAAAPAAVELSAPASAQQPPRPPANR